MFEYNGVKFTGHRNWTKKELSADFSELCRKLHWFSPVEHYNYAEFYAAAERANEVYDVYTIGGRDLQVVPVDNSFTYIVNPNGAANFVRQPHQPIRAAIPGRMQDGEGKRKMKTNNQYWAQPRGTEYDKAKAISPIFTTQKAYKEWCKNNKHVDCENYAFRPNRIAYRVNL